MVFLKKASKEEMEKYLMYGLQNENTTCGMLVEKGFTGD
jgi:hypothetical protein